VQEIARDIDDEAYGFWQKANALRDKAIDCLGNIDYKVAEEIRILGAQSIGLSRASRMVK
jgi:hypothetical protein